MARHLFTSMASHSQSDGTGWTLELAISTKFRNETSPAHQAGASLSMSSIPYACFASRRDLPKPSVASFTFRFFTTTWGICFSLKS